MAQATPTPAPATTAKPAVATTAPAQKAPSEQELFEKAMRENLPAPAADALIALSKRVK